MRRQPQDRVSRFVDDLLKRRRPARFRATSEELEALTAATDALGKLITTLLSDAPERAPSR